MDYQFTPQRLACRLFDHRHSEMLSFRQAAQMIGIPVSTLHRLENGETREPSLSVLLKVINWLEIPPGHIFTAGAYLDGQCPVCGAQLVTRDLPFFGRVEVCDVCQRAHDSRGFPITLTVQQQRLAFPEFAEAEATERAAMRAWLDSITPDDDDPDDFTPYLHNEINPGL